MSKKRRQRSKLESIDQINMTPLIDLTFLLLIVFMITMPLIEYSTPVSTPQLNSAPMPTDKKNQIFVVDANGEFFVGKEKISEIELIEQLNALKISRPDTQILIKGDEDCKYKFVIKLMKIIKNNGFEDVSIVTSEEK